MRGKRTAVIILMMAVVVAAGAILWLGRSPGTGQQDPIHTAAISSQPPSSETPETTPEAEEGETPDLLGLRGPVESETQAGPEEEPVYENRAVRNVTPDRLTRSREVSGPLKRIKSAIRKPEKPKRARKEAVNRPVIRAAGYLENAKKQRFDLANIDALEEDATCNLANGETWPCGASARTALRRLVRGRTAECTAENADAEAGRQPVPEADDEETAMVFTCRIGNIEINRWLVAYGWARPTRTADSSYAKLEKTAKEQQRGQWRTAAPQPLSNVVVTGSSVSLAEELGGPAIDLADNAEPDSVEPLLSEELPAGSDGEQEADEQPVTLDWQEPNILQLIQ